MYKIGFIGVGNMGEAILSGILSQGWAKASDIVFTTKTSRRRQYIAETYQVIPVNNNRELAQATKMMILATTPNIYPTVIDEIKPFVTNEHIIISITPSYSLESLRAMFAPIPHIVRTMPNTPAKIGYGVTGICGHECDHEALRHVESLFASIGKTITVDESQFPLVGTLSGSNPAFIEYLTKAMIEFGIEQGLNDDVARFLVLNTIGGTVELIANSELPLATLIAQVCSKGGSTIEGIHCLEKLKVDEALKRALLATTKRFKEMELD